MDKLTTVLIEIREMDKTLSASRFYALCGIGAVISIGYLVKAAATLIMALR